MAIISLSFNIDPATTGVAVGDAVYYIDSANIVDSASNNLNNIIYIGTVDDFSGSGPYYIHVDTGSLNFNMPTQDDFVFFSKNNEYNMSTLLGYYAQATFINDSTEQAELFAVNANVTESSK